MPPALATSKRKFQRLLDNLTNGSTTSLTSAPPRPTTASSSSQLPPGGSVISDHPAKRIRASTSMTSLASAHTAQAAPPQPGASAPRQEPPKFSPWSHATFLQRLKTFASVSLWHPKPDALSEVEWAKRGWVCVGVNTVACKGVCGKRVVVKLERERRRIAGDRGEGVEGEGGEAQQREDEEEREEIESDDAEIGAALVGRYKALIVDGHDAGCLWRRAGCKKDIYRLPIASPSHWQPELHARYQSLSAVSRPIADVKLQPSETSSAGLLDSLPRDVLAGSADADNSSNEEQQSNTQAQTKSLHVSLFGWKGVLEAGNALLSCDACFQRIGLWMYDPGYKRRRTQSGEDAEEDDDDDEQPSELDLVELHREHCPWRNPSSQCSTAGRPAAAGGEEQVSNEDEDGASATSETPTFSREEIEKQDKEREGRLKKLKRAFTIKGIRGIRGVGGKKPTVPTV
ncbi:hypothetical protein LTR66_000528 [Elasticomyces elasticus]|nr:hypothetical protein LTR66_000528 [Elasticomyces elasticus]